MALRSRDGWSFCTFPRCDCEGETPVCEDYCMEHDMPDPCLMCEVVAMRRAQRYL